MDRELDQEKQTKNIIDNKNRKAEQNNNEMKPFQKRFRKQPL